MSSPLPSGEKTAELRRGVEGSKVLARICRDRKGLLPMG